MRKPLLKDEDILVYQKNWETGGPVPALEAARTDTLQRDPGIRPMIVVLREVWDSWICLAAYTEL